MLQQRADEPYFKPMSSGEAKCFLLATSPITCEEIFDKYRNDCIIHLKINGVCPKGSKHELMVC